MKHKHYDMIVAKAANIELVVFEKGPNCEGWRLSSVNGSLPRFYNDGEYFLCLPQHKEAVLNALNNGESMVRVKGDPQGWTSGIAVNWSEKHWCMDLNVESRIKPKKEKRWIGIAKDEYVTPIQESKHLAECKASAQMRGEFQFIEIEVEV